MLRVHQDGERCEKHGYRKVYEALVVYNELIKGQRYCTDCLDLEDICAVCGDTSMTNILLLSRHGPILANILPLCSYCWELDERLTNEHNIQSSEHAKMKLDCWCKDSPLLIDRSLTDYRPGNSSLS